MTKLFELITLLRAFLRKLKQDAVSAYAAQAAFFTILSAFPFLMFLMTLIQYLPLTESDLLRTATRILPETVSPFVVNIITEIYTTSSAAIISVTAITALWSASKAFLALIRGLNAVYEIEESRNYILLRIVSTFYTLMFAIMLIISLSLLVFGNSILLGIQKSLPKLQDLFLLIISVRATTFMCIMILFFIALFLFIPNRKSHLLAELPGAIIASAGWMGFSYLYSFYIDHMSNFANTYGSLTAIVLLMLWLYICMYMMFIGAEINSMLKAYDTNRIKKLFSKQK